MLFCFVFLCLRKTRRPSVNVKHPCNIIWSGMPFCDWSMNYTKEFIIKKYSLFVPCAGNWSRMNNKIKEKIVWHCPLSTSTLLLYKYSTSTLLPIGTVLPFCIETSFLNLFTHNSTEIISQYYNFVQTQSPAENDCWLFGCMEDLT